jgi:hypothetical protein
MRLRQTIVPGVITDNDWQRPELQARYDGYFSWFLQEKINQRGYA